MSGVIELEHVGAISWNSTGPIFLVAIRSILVTSSRGCHEDATRKTVPWNLSYTLQLAGGRVPLISTAETG